MFDFNFNQEESNSKELVLRFESMVAQGNVLFMDQEAFQHIIDYYEDQHRLDRALLVIEYALKQHCYSATFHIRKAQFLLEENQLEAAAEALEFAKLYEPTNIDIFLTESEILHQAEELDAALEILENSLIYADSGDYEDIFLMMASVHETAENYQAAYHALKRVLNINPFHEMAFSRLWLCVELTGDYAASIEFHLEIIDKAPYSYWAWYNLAHAYNQMGLLEKAIDAYDYAIVINERFEFAYRDIIACYFNLENYVAALRYINEYKSFFEIDADLLLWEGECMEYRGHFDAARQVYAKALKLSNLEGRVFYRIAVTYAAEDAWPLALKAFEQAWAQNKDNEEFCIALAEVYNQLDQIDNAYLFFEKATKLSPELFLPWQSYLEFLIDEGDFELAEEVLDKATVYHGDLLDIQLYDIAICLLSGKKQEASVALLEYLQDPKAEIQRIFAIAPELENEALLLQMIQDHLNGR